MFSIEAALAIADVNDQSEAQGEIGGLAEEAYWLDDSVFKNFDFVAGEIGDDLAASIARSECHIHEADVDSYRRRGVLGEKEPRSSDGKNCGLRHVSAHGSRGATG